MVLREAAEFDAHPGFVAMKDGDAAFEAEAGFAGVTGVQVERAADALVVLLMGMAEDNDIGLVTVDGFANDGMRGARDEDVVNEEFLPGEREDLGLAIGQPRIIVAQHGSDGRDGLQFEDDLVEPDVAAVQNVGDALEDFVDSWIKVSVRVRDKPDLHGAMSGEGRSCCRGRMAKAVTPWLLRERAGRLIPRFPRELRVILFRAPIRWRR